MTNTLALLLTLKAATNKMSLTSQAVRIINNKIISYRRQQPNQNKKQKTKNKKQKTKNKKQKTKKEMHKSAHHKHKLVFPTFSGEDFALEARISDAEIAVNEQLIDKVYVLFGWLVGCLFVPILCTNITQLKA